MALAPLFNQSSQNPLAGIGQIKSSTRTRAVIADGAAAQLSTVTYAGSPSAGTYTLTFTPNGGDAIAVSYVAVGSDTNTLVAAGMADAINNKIGVSNYVLAYNTAGVLYVQGKGTRSFTLADTAQSGGTQTVNAITTTAAAAADVEVGRALCLSSTTTDNGTPKGKRPVSTMFTAQTQTFTITSAASAFFVVEVVMNGITSRTAPIAHNTNTATTIDDIDAALDVVMDARADAGHNLVATNTDTTLILTADVPGAVFSARVIVSGSASASATGPVFNGQTYLYSVRAGLLGFATNQGASNTSFNDSAGVWQGGLPVATAYNEEVCLATTAPAAGSGLWISVASGTDGQVYSAGAANRVWIADGLWTLDGYANLSPLGL